MQHSYFLISTSDMGTPPAQFRATLKGVGSEERMRKALGP